MPAEIKYNGKTITTLNGGEYATLHVKEKDMVDDIRVELTEESGGADSYIPPEISTEAEMTALLETAPVGSVFKYVGETTDKYENGTKYELCEE